MSFLAPLFRRNIFSLYLILVSILFMGGPNKGYAEGQMVISLISTSVIYERDLEEKPGLYVFVEERMVSDASIPGTLENPRIHYHFQGRMVNRLGEIEVFAIESSSREKLSELLLNLDFGIDYNSIVQTGIEDSQKNPGSGFEMIGGVKRQLTVVFNEDEVSVEQYNLLPKLAYLRGTDKNLNHILEIVELVLLSYSQDALNYRF